jgi:uncharacterized membrane protein required for colicin V production
MFIVVDIALVLIFVLCLIIGWKRGFFDQMISLFSGIIAFFAAYFLTPLAAPFVSKHLFLTRISEKASELIRSIGDGIGGADLFGSGKANETFRAILEKFGADYDAIKEKFASAVTEGTDKAAGAIADHIAEPVSYALSYALCFLAIFILTLIALWILKCVLKIADKLPVIKQANALLGLVMGAVTGIIIIWVLSVMLKLGLPYLSNVQPKIFPEDLFERSFVLRLVYKLNAVRAMIDFSYIKKLIGV